jgi:cellulose synthase (UDP-forming)
MNERTNSAGPKPAAAALLLVTMVVAFSYLVVRIILSFTSEGFWYERLIAAALLLADSFFVINCLGYFANIRRSLAAGDQRLRSEELPELNEYPPVAIVVASQNEPLEVVEANLICFRNLTYPNKQIYFLDDTRYELAKDNPETMRQYGRAVDELCRRIQVNLFRRR